MTADALPAAAPGPELAGGVIVVTGAANGIGAAISRLAAARGARVALADLDADAAHATATAIAAALGLEPDQLSAYGVDVADEEQVRAVVAAAVGTHGPLTGLVNNAGTIVVKSVAETTAAEWDRVLAVNAGGTFHGCKHAVRQFLAQGSGGSIVNIGSISAVVGMPEQAAYCASKGAVLQLSRQVAADYSGRGIRCNVVGPGSVDTTVLRDYLGGQSDPAAAEAAIIAGHPIGRIAQPLEIAEAVCFLLSARASFVTGTNLQVDGGYSAV